MAQYKSRAGQPWSSQRIDGQVWQVSGSGGTIRGWGYPTSSPSAQFERFNSIVRGSVCAYAALSLAQQDSWAAFRRGWHPAQQYLCFYDFEYYSTDSGSGEVAFKAVNCYPDGAGSCSPFRIRLFRCWCLAEMPLFVAPAGIAGNLV